ncbi:MAG: hypothetical protein E4H14_05205 [Candidatus Thorarchaeota archaeon]|nr:MAG: hypothetical protein E4H14_05205 [Candidatus Thorarchaeota archaeon]
MSNIDPGEDAVITKQIGIFLEAIENSLFERGHSMEKIQNVNRRGMEIRLMTEEILQVDSEIRSRRIVEIAVRKFVDRMDIEFSEEDVQELIEMLCKAFNIQT